MIGLSFNQLFQNKMNYEHHLKKIIFARSTIDVSKPKSKLKCTKQPLSQFHRVYQMQLENRHLCSKITHPESSIQNHNQNRKLIKNHRKHYYEEYERNLENTGLLRRIVTAKTSYNRKQLLSQRKENEQYLQTISKFGYKQKKKSPFHSKCKTITEDLHSFFKTNRWSEFGNQYAQNSHAFASCPSQTNNFRVFKNLTNHTKSNKTKQSTCASSN